MISFYYVESYRRMYAEFNSDKMTVMFNTDVQEHGGVCLCLMQPMVEHK